MKVSASGIQFIKDHEGLSLVAYPDANGYSIGYGHYGAVPGQVITQGQADSFLKSDIATVENVLNATMINLSQNQFDALADFIYNVGQGNFQNSTLLKKLKAGNYIDAVNELGKWIYSNGQQLPALIKRRADEAALFLKDDSSKIIIAIILFGIGVFMYSKSKKK
jgi:lysozyme